MYGSPAIASDGSIVLATTGGQVLSVGGGGLCDGVAALPCDDGDPCTNDVCIPDTGVCEHISLCDDGNPCTADSCVVGSGCTVEPLLDGTDCDDGLECTSGEQCT